MIADKQHKMPKGKKRAFIDKKKAVTFHLVHRSQRDPLITDETAPQHVLVESKSRDEERAKRKEEERKFGVFFDDDYDYMQHLRERDQQDAVHWEYIPPANLKGRDQPNGIEPDTKPERSTDNKPESKLQLPSSLFASEFEEAEGMLRKAAPHLGPRPDLDPDIIAALDDDFDFENENNHLEDNFIEMAMGGEGGEGGDDDEFDENDEHSDIDSNFDGEEDYDEDECDNLGPLRNNRFPRFDDEETKSRFTEYSMSSSVIRRNQQLELLDDRFEKFFEKYDEPEIGALDCEEIEGHVDMTDELMEQCLVEFKRSDNDLEYDKKWDEERVRKIMEEESSDEELVELEVTDDEPGKKWDCESVLSTYSSAYNHPKLIDEPKRRKSKLVINPKTGMPMNVFNGENNQLTLKSLAKLNADTTNSSDEKGTGPKSLCAQSVLSTLSVLSLRPKDETPEEKRQRKKLLKEYRSERRFERKSNTQAFKDEKKRQTQIDMNNRNNIQGNRIL